MAAKRLTATVDPLTEKVLERIMKQNNCSRAAAGEILLKYGTKAIIEHLQQKKALDNLFRANGNTAI